MASPILNPEPSGPLYDISMLTTRASPASNSGSTSSRPPFVISGTTNTRKSATSPRYMGARFLRNALKLEFEEPEGFAPSLSGSLAFFLRLSLAIISVRRPRVINASPSVSGPARETL